MTVPATLAASAAAAYGVAAATVAPAELARLVVPGVGSARVLVTRAVEGAAELVFAEAPPAPTRTLHRRVVLLTSLPPAPAAERVATLLAVPDEHGRLRTDTVWAVLEAPVDGTGPVPHTAAPSAAERRSAIRVPVDRTISIHHPGVVAGMVARTEDLSAAGVAVSGAAALTRGDLVRLRLRLDGGRPLDAIGEVRRRDAADRHGLQLVQMRPQDRLWLERWLAAHR
ncbi:hypothetical protein DSM112329_01057 [Paraconexibacter sp. AEG42_29]|uniref:PilZ domain-containing protein n=1 Tax=Paraconexibacter sp. AEG42_29 TaxID=2997339 RepID=A0AAU7ARE9_9ACTN